MSSFQNDHGPWKLLTYLFVVHLEPPDRLVMGSGVIRKTLRQQLVTSGPSLLDPPIKHCEELKKAFSSIVCVWVSKRTRIVEGSIWVTMYIYERYIYIYIIYIYKRIYAYAYICCFWWRYARPRKLIGLWPPKRKGLSPNQPFSEPSFQGG